MWFRDMHGRCSRPSAAAAAAAAGGAAAPGTPCRRDLVLQVALGLLVQQALPACAAEKRGFGRYIKKKALDPLVT